MSWEEPNRADTPPLHIASRGDRYSSLTGVWWLDDRQYVVNHRSGLRLAVFNLDAGDKPVHKAAIPHLTDDVAAKKLDENRWLVAVSGCWASAYSLFELSPSGFTLLKTVQESRLAPFMRGPLRRGKTFCHGVAYGPTGNLVITYHTGLSPRIVSVSNDETWRLPSPWGARDACFDKDGSLYAVANTANPSPSAYEQTSAAIWKLEDGEFRMIVESPGAHFDAAAIYDGKLYANNQHDDNVSVFDLAAETELDPIVDDAFSFPHGVDVSPNGILAVTNYGTSTVVLRDLP
ncbi:hypothetical protein [Mycolicibacterium iranicum]|nr:hypothetical protein [Mycolicibacterium iranicum]